MIEENRDFCEVHEKSHNEMEELKKFQEFHYCKTKTNSSRIRTLSSELSGREQE